MTDEQRLSEIDPEQLVQVRRLTEARRVLSEALERLRQGVRDSQDVIEEVEGDLLAALDRVPPRPEPRIQGALDILGEFINTTLEGSAKRRTLAHGALYVLHDALARVPPRGGEENNDDSRGTPQSEPELSALPTGSPTKTHSASRIEGIYLRARNEQRRAGHGEHDAHRIALFAVYLAGRAEAAPQGARGAGQ